MAEESKGRRVAPGVRLERAILLQLLSGEGERRPRAELAAELGGDARAFDDALLRLCEAGVACVDGPDVWASPAARRIDELGLIGI